MIVARPGFKNFGTGAESESEKVTPATSAGKLAAAVVYCQVLLSRSIHHGIRLHL